MIVNLKEKRKKLGYTQLDVSLAIGVARQTYNRWEQHQDSMPLGMYVAVVDELERANTVRQGGLVTGNTLNEVVADQKESEDEGLETSND